jgi:hypothetical protein
MKALLMAEARVETERSSRYLVQLCRHVSEAAQAHPQMQAHVEWSDDHGKIGFGWGTCTLRADPGVLTLRVEASDEESLRRVERRVANRLERLGGGDQLTVTWTRPLDAGEQLPGQPSRPPQNDTRISNPPPYPDSGDDPGVGPVRDSTTGTSRWGKVILFIAIVLFLLMVIVLHLMGGGLRGVHG